jgi:hypothetical protein
VREVGFWRPWATAWAGVIFELVRLGRRLALPIGFAIVAGAGKPVEVDVVEMSRKAS